MDFLNLRNEGHRLNSLRENADFVIPRADVARGICFSPGICEKADSSLRSG